jgi:hypothetical protein
MLTPCAGVLARSWCCGWASVPGAGLASGSRGMGRAGTGRVDLEMTFPVPGMRWWSGPLSSGGRGRITQDRPPEKVLIVVVELDERARWRCPGCGVRGKPVERDVVRWRILGVHGKCCFLEAGLSRIWCPEHGKVTAAVPWARHDDRFSRPFEEFAAWKAAHMPCARAADQPRISWEALGTPASVSFASITSHSRALAARSAATSSGAGGTSGTNHTRSSPAERDQDATPGRLTVIRRTARHNDLSSDRYLSTSAVNQYSVVIHTVQVRLWRSKRGRTACPSRPARPSRERTSIWGNPAMPLSLS